MRKLWDDDAWEEYLEWQKTDKKTLKRINKRKMVSEVQLHIRPSSFFWGAAPDSVPAS